MATGDFYSDWFSRTTITPPTPEERRRWKMDYLCNLAFSPLAQELVDRFGLLEIQEAEDAQAFAEITDPEVRNKVDMAAGRISAAYQLLGFCVGHTAQSGVMLF